jgi:hypothetical protein
MPKVGLWGNPQFYSMREESELVNLTWVYCICHFSLGVGSVAGWLLIFLLSLASAKPQSPKLLKRVR